MALNFDLNGNDPETPIVPYLRLVPAGIRRLKNGKLELRASLLFSPIPDPSGTSQLRLSNWPANVSGIFSGEKLKFRLVAHGDDSGECVGPDNGTEITFTSAQLGAEKDFPDVFEGQAAALTGYWKKALIPEFWQGTKVTDTQKTQVWNALLVCIRNSLDGDRSKVGKIDGDPTATPLEDDNFGKSGQLVKGPAKDTRTVDSILSVPYADTAIALDQRRTNALIGSIKKALGGEKELPSLPDSPFEDVMVEEKTGAAIGAEAEFQSLDTVEKQFAYIGQFTGFAATQVTVPEPPKMQGSFPVSEDSDGESEENKQTRAFDRVVLWKYANATLEAALDEEKKIDLADTKASHSLKKYRDLFAQELSEARKGNFGEVRRATKVKRHKTLSTDKLMDQREDAVENFELAKTSLANGKATVVCRYRAYDEGELERDAAQTEQIQRATDASEYGHWPQHTETGIREEIAPEQGLLDCAAQAYFSIEGNPTLARAFGLAADVYLEIEKLPANARYGILSAELSDSATGLPRPWSLTKLRTGADGDPFGWPVTMAEYLLADKAQGELPPESQHCIGQFDGLCVMGADNEGVFKDGDRVGVAPRYELTTMDVRAALEAEDQRLRAMQTDGVGSEDSRTTKAIQRESVETGPDFQSLGLALLCRSAQSDAIRRLAAVDAKCGVNGSCVKECGGDGSTYVIHDAEDLSLGFRLMIGMPKGGNTGSAWQTNWRPLTARSVKYGGSGKGGPTIERVLRSAVGKNGSDPRIALESAFQALPTRDLKAPDPNDTGENIETIVDETVGIWDGSPGGVDCTAVRGQSQDMEDIMPFGRINRVPTGSSRYKVFPLRNGLPYRIAMSVAYAGGHSLAPGALLPDPIPTNNASDNVGIRERLYYPSALLAKGKDNEGPAKPYFRALRQSRIGAPSVMLPEGHSKRKNGPMGYEHAGKMVVRSWRTPDLKNGESEDDRDTSRALPTIAQRILMVPNLPQALAARHLVGPRSSKAVFDDCTEDGPPKGAHRLLVYDNELGFPAVKTRTRPGFNGEAHLVSRKIVATANERETRQGESLSDLVFKRIRGTQTKIYTYYPDPAADKLIIRARRASDDKTRAILPGKPIQIDVGSVYPNATNVLFTLRNRSTRSGGVAPQQEQIIKNDGVRFLNTRSTQDIIVDEHKRVQAHNVELHLEPGDQFDIECWYVPSGWRLAHDFAAVQSLAARLTRFGRPATAAEVADAVDRTGLPDAFAAYLAETLNCGANTGVKYIGLQGTHTPDTGFLRAVADALHKFMLEHPVAEISGMRTLAATHAVNVPARANKPKIRALDKNQEPFPDPACIVPEDQAVLRAVRPAELGEPIFNYSDQKAISEGSTLFAMKGAVRINRERIDTLEIMARTVSPDADRFDDLRRGRSLAHRIAGTWPKQTGSDTGAFRKASDIFGFKVNRDGTTELPKATVSLLRIDGLPYPETSGASDFLLDDYFLEAFGDNSVTGRAHDEGVTSRRHAFPDGKARRMQVWVNGMARTAEEMKSAAREMKRGDPWAGGSGVVYENGELIPSEPLSPAAMRRLSNVVEVILPATLRPAVPDARAPVPVFETEQKLERRGDQVILTSVRRARTRIPLGRGWYSSGEDERLGVVLWPPDQMLADKAWLAINRVPLRDRDACGPVVNPGGFAAVSELGKPGQAESPTRIADLPQFSDEDLGPGGAFVTRRGGDPVRRGETPFADETQVFLSKETFSDLWLPEGTAGRAEFVPHAEMPLAKTENTLPGEVDEEATPPLSVALVTYRPRFDPEREEWYADVLLQPGKSSDPFVRFGLVRYQPHTRPDLRCSQPVTQWAQTLPERKVELAVTPGGDTAVLTVTGPASKGRAIEGEGIEKYAEKQREASRIAPVMRITAFTEGKSPAGVATRDTVPLGADGSFSIEVNAEVDPFGQGVWRTEVPMSLVSSDLNLLVEEVEYFLPAEFDEEPLTRKRLEDFKKEYWQKTGPRFSTRLDLKKMVGLLTE